MCNTNIWRIAGVDISAGFNGWSLKTLKGVVAEAGAHLEQLSAEFSEDGRSLIMGM